MDPGPCPPDFPISRSISTKGPTGAPASRPQAPSPPGTVCHSAEGGKNKDVSTQKRGEVSRRQAISTSTAGIPILAGGWLKIALVSRWDKVIISFGYYSAPLEDGDEPAAAGSPPRPRVRVEAPCSGAVSEGGGGAFHDLGGGGAGARGRLSTIRNTNNQVWSPSRGIQTVQVPRHPTRQVLHVTCVTRRVLCSKDQEGFSMAVLNRGRNGHARPNEIGHIAGQGASHSMEAIRTTPRLPRRVVTQNLTEKTD